MSLSELLALVGRPWLFVPVMIASWFFGALSIGGLSAARMVGPLALPVAIIAIIRHGGLGVRGTSLPYWIGAYCIVAFASLLWSSAASTTVELLFSLVLALVYTVAIVALTRTRAHLRIALRAIVISGIALSVVGAGALARAGGDPLLAQEVVGDRNFFAAFLAVSVSASVTFIAWPQAGYERPLGIAGVMLGVAGVVGSDSQGGMLSLLAIAAMAAFLLPSAAVRRRLAPAYIAAVPLAVAGLIGVLGAGGFQSQAAGSGLKGAIVTSSVDRLNLWLGALYAYRDSPYTGVGLGAYGPSSAQWMLETPGVDLQLYRLPDHPQEAHNSYVETLSELGPVGLLVFLGMILGAVWTLSHLFRGARRARDREIESFAVALLMAIGAFAVASVFLSVTTNRTWWVIFGLTIAAARIVYDERVKRRGSDRSAVTARPVFTR